MIKIASLGSGSKGNATVVQVADTLLLVDCGFGLKDIEGRLRDKGLRPEQLSAILVTHEHGDHLKGAPMLANRYGVPLYASFGTSRHFKRAVPSAEVINPHRRLSLGAIEVEPVTVPHDASEPTQFVFHHAGLAVGLLTDLGSITPHVQKAYQNCDLLMLECNHDPAMLSEGPYPPSLKRRVGGNYGHLSNEQAAQLVTTVNRSNLQKILVSHISEQNNDVALALDTLAPAVDGYSIEIDLLTQQDGCDWIGVRRT